MGYFLVGLIITYAHSLIEVVSLRGKEKIMQRRIAGSLIGPESPRDPPNLRYQCLYELLVKYAARTPRFLD